MPVYLVVSIEFMYELIVSVLIVPYMQQQKNALVKLYVGYNIEQDSASLA